MMNCSSSSSSTSIIHANHLPCRRSPGIRDIGSIIPLFTSSWNKTNPWPTTSLVITKQDTMFVLSWALISFEMDVIKSWISWIFTFFKNRSSVDLLEHIPFSYKASNHWSSHPYRQQVFLVQDNWLYESMVRQDNRRHQSDTILGHHPLNHVRKVGHHGRQHRRNRLCRYP